MTTINEIVGNYVPINQIEKEYRTNFIYDELRIYDNGKKQILGTVDDKNKNLHICYIRIEDVRKGK